MRDAFGGVFMIRLLLVFMFIYVSFTAISLNYAKAFRVKNKIIDLIEQEEVLKIGDFYSNGSGSGISKLDKILKNSGYHRNCIQGDSILKDESYNTKGICYGGVVITVKSNTERYITYNVYTYADWNLGALNMILALGGQTKNERGIADGAWEIAGEAKVTKRLNK